jgi:uncharacterized protein YjeT (DUF2065 family)
MPDRASARAAIRKDSHLALGCGFGIALVVVGALVVYLLVTA